MGANGSTANGSTSTESGRRWKTIIVLPKWYEGDRAKKSEGQS